MLDLNVFFTEKWKSPEVIFGCIASYVALKLFITYFLIIIEILDQVIVKM